MNAGRLRVVIVDDSSVVRKLLGDALAREPDIEVVGTAADPYAARELIFRHRPDVITLDIEMPRMDGLSFLTQLMAHQPMPVIVVSSITQHGSAASVEALRLGAIDVIAKPGGPASVGEVTTQLVRRMRAIRQAPPIRFTTAAGDDRPAPVTASRRQAPTGPGPGLIVIGASTGGTQAIETVLTRLPADVPPVLIVQHMPAGFTRAFAARLDATCPMRVCEAAGGEVLQAGTAYIAPGDRHMVVERSGVRLMAQLRDGPPVHYQRPAVDVLFHAAARVTGVRIVAAVLTGMGADGAEGLLALRKAGAETFAQDERSCVVFGMPREAIALGGAAHVVTLLQMPFALMGGLKARALPQAT